jgi:hypothetical protein
MAVVLTMAQQSKNNNANSSHNNSVYVNNSTATSQQQQKQDLKAMFHDFLGMKGTTDSPVVLAPKNKDGSPSASAAPKNKDGSPSASASLGASSGGGRGPLSSTSDLASGQYLLYNLKASVFFLEPYRLMGPFDFLFSLY